MPGQKQATGPRRAPVQKRSRETVIAIIQATADVLVRLGYEKTTTNRIARRAGVSIGTLYHYFPNKESIFQALVEHAIADTAGQVVRSGREVLEQPGLEAMTRRLILICIQMLRRREKLARAIFNEIPGTSQTAMIRAVEERLVAVLPQLGFPDLDRLRRRDPARYEAIVRLLLGMGSAGLYRIALDPPEGVPEEALVDILVRMFIGALKE